MRILAGRACTPQRNPCAATLRSRIKVMDNEERIRARATGLTRGLDYGLHHVPSLADLRPLALANFNRVEGANRESADDRIVVNFLRHQCSDYEANLLTIQRRQGAVPWNDALALAYLWVRVAHLEAISERFPEFADACRGLARPPRSRYFHRAYRS